jgi:hypothetical protein
MDATTLDWDYFVLDGAYLRKRAGNGLSSVDEVWT